MLTLRLKPWRRCVALGFALLFTSSAWAVVVEDNFTGASSKYNWKSFNGACLTAGDNTGNIPACVGLSYYNETLVGGYSGKLPDPVGKGALRFTNGFPGGYGQNGAVVSNFTFPSNQGLNVTFTTYTYRGDGGGAAGDGADGISFYLMDGSYAPGIGAWGGSLAYSCSNSNTPHDGLVGGYVGLGMDEYGNFLNKGDNTSTGVAAVNFLGNGTYQPGRIGMRGAGNVAWSWLNKNYPSYYPSSLSSSQQQAAVQNTCKTGTLWNYSKATKPVDTKATSASGAATLMNYAVIPGANVTLAPTIQIANEAALTRGSGLATPTTATPITYNLTITQDGLLSLAYSYNGGTYQPVITKQSITASNGAVPKDFRFAFAGSTGGSTNIHEVTCFKATPANQAASSAGINVQQSGEVKTGTQVYLAYYHSDNWWGQLTSQDLVYNAATQIVSINPTANWDASCVLTGGACASTGTTTGAAQGSTARNILTWNPTLAQGVPFQWTNLSTAQQNALNTTPTSDSNGSKRLDYLRGDRSNEFTSSGSGLFRARTSVLGDIINSSPTFVGPPANGGIYKSWADGLYSGASMAENGSGAQTYASFASSYATRQNVVYDGANDGLLHGFRAGSYDASGNYVSTNNDGKEVLAYMPNAVVNTVHNSADTTLDFPSTKYAHNYFVDATPGVGDLFYNNAWHTWLVGGLGAGAMVGGPTTGNGNALYALDVTDPTQFSEANANKLVLGEWSSANLVCATDTGSSKCASNFGKTYGTPAIRRLHNGNWAVIFGNGLDSSKGTAGIYVMVVGNTGTPTFYYFDTGYGPIKDPLGKSRANGIAYVTPADFDGDHITDYVYAGDVFGNIWRFDLTSNNPSNWKASTYGGGSAAPLFSTPGGQPITTQLMVASTPGSGSPRVMVDFGTGRITPQTTTAPASYATGTQTLYGIWDYDTTAWNALSATRYASLSAPQAVTASNLQAQTVLGTYSATTSGAGAGYRTVSSNPVCWAGSTSCSSGNTQYGWKFDLPSSSEQVIYSPILTNGAFIVNTTIPTTNSVLTCTVDSAKGWTMALSPATGGAFANSFFGDANNNFVNINGQIVSGIALSATGSPSVVTAGGNPYLVNQTVSGIGTVNRINPAVGGAGGRLTWIQLR